VNVSVRISAIEAYERALARADDRAAEDVAGLLATDVVVLTNFGRADGIEAASAALTGSRLAGLASGARWSEPDVDGDRIGVTALQPASAPVGGLEFTFWFTGEKIARVEQQILPAAPSEPAALRLTDDIKKAVNGALDNQTPMLIAYGDDAGRIHLSFRGTVQAYGDEQLALWARDPQAGLPRNIADHPHVTLFYNDPTSRTSYSFQGRAHIETDAVARDRIFDNSNPREQYMDYHRRGAGIVVDLDRVEGRGPAGRVLMTRDASA
jgi:hypothetical protein